LSIPLKIYVDYLVKNYRRMYGTTYSPTPENVVRALEVYSYCMVEGLYRSVDECVARELEYRRRRGLPTYSYRRMENFIKELGLYRVGGNWLVTEFLVKVSGEYSSTKSDVFVDVSHFLYAPLMDLTVDEDLAIGRTIEVIEGEVGVNPVLMGFIEWRVEHSLIEPLNTKYINYREVKQVVEYEGYVSFAKASGRGYRYDVRGSYEEYLFLPFTLVPRSVGSMVRG